LGEIQYNVEEPKLFAIGEYTHSAISNTLFLTCHACGNLFIPRKLPQKYSPFFELPYYSFIIPAIVSSSLLGVRAAKLLVTPTVNEHKPGTVLNRWNK